MPERLKNDAIVVGGDHHNTLGVVRSLGRKGIKCHLIIVPCSKSSYVSKSRYVNTSTILRRLDELIPWLLNYKSSEKPVLFCCSDPVASIVDMHASELKEFFYIPESQKGQGYLSSIMDKKVMAGLANLSGLPVPRSWYDIENIEFPCFIKPLVSKDGSKKDIYRCSSEEDLIQYLNGERIASDFQFQEYIDKVFEFQLIGCSLDGGRRVIIPGISKIIRSSETSNTGYLKYIDLNSISFKYLDETKNFIKVIGFSGLFSVEFIRDEKGNDYFMEINLRNDGNAICVTASGVNLPYLWYKYNVTKNIDDENIVLHKQVFVQPDFDDLALARRKKISFATWLKSWITADCHMEFDHRDIKPFFARLYQFIARRV